MNGDQDSLYQYMQQQYGNPIPPSTPVNGIQQATQAVAQQQDTKPDNSWMLSGGNSPQNTPIQLGTTNSAAKQAGMSSMMGALAGI